MAPRLIASRKGGKIETNGGGVPLEFRPLQFGAVEAVVHRPIPALLTGTSRRKRGIDRRTLRGAREITVQEPHLAGLDVFGLQPRPCFIKELSTVPAREIGI